LLTTSNTVCVLEKKPQHLKESAKDLAIKKIATTFHKEDTENSMQPEDNT